jgi:hypothetical protein
MRSKFKSLAVLGAVLALSAVTATAAQATVEGPFFKVSGARLASGSTKVLKGKARTSIEFIQPSFGIHVTCSQMAYATGAKINGSSGANSATSEGTVEFSGCQVSGDGPGCEIENEKITTSLLKGTLGYATSSRTGRLLLMLKPKTGSTFMGITFVGAECTHQVGTILITGGIIATLGTSANPLEVGLNEAQAKTAVFNFPAPTPVAKMWTESAGTLSELTSTISWSGAGVKFGGSGEMELESAPEWGIFT